MDTHDDKIDSLDDIDQIPLDLLSTGTYAPEEDTSWPYNGDDI